MLRNTRFATIAALAALMALAGCGDSLNLVPVSGTVTYNGKPVEGANVTFMPETGPIGTGTTDASGKYTLTTEGKPGAVVGKHGVMINKSSAVAGASSAPSPDDMMKMASKMGKGAASMSKPELPVKYSTTQGSGLSADVKADGANTFDFPLAD